VYDSCIQVIPEVTAIHDKVTWGLQVVGKLILQIARNVSPGRCATAFSEGNVTNKERVII
jgi:hypothetical protein